MIDIKKLKQEDKTSGFMLKYTPDVSCDWAIVDSHPAQSTVYLRLPVEGELACMGIGKDFVETGLYFVHQSDIGRKQDEINYENEYLPIGEKFSRKVVFLDRDGILIKDTGYPGKPENVIFNNESLEFLRHMKGLGYEFIVLTNQSGIGRGYYTENDFSQITRYISDYFSEQGIEFLDTYHCPYHVDAKLSQYQKESGFRKPAPGMILRASEKYQVDISKSLMIGDRDSDRIKLSSLKSVTVGNTITNPDYQNFKELINHLKEK